MFEKIKKFYDRMGAQVHSPYASAILGFLFFLEAIFFLPTDPILILFCVEQRSKAWHYATIATFSSVFGGIVSYTLGFTLWEMAGPQILHNSWINYVLSPEKFQTIATNYQRYTWWYVFLAGFTPIPYKAATLTAGFCKISLIPFILCSILARGARFYLYAAIIQIFGVHIKKSINRYFTIIMLLSIALIVAFIWFF